MKHKTNAAAGPGAGAAAAADAGTHVWTTVATIVLRWCIRSSSGNISSNSISLLNEILQNMELVFQGVVTKAIIPQRTKIIFPPLQNLTPQFSNYVSKATVATGATMANEWMNKRTNERITLASQRAYFNYNFTLEFQCNMKYQFRPMESRFAV